jgi:hypothetical protein
VASAEDLSILGDEACADRNAAFGLALTSLFDGSDESWISFHFDQCLKILFKAVQSVAGYILQW